MVDSRTDEQKQWKTMKNSKKQWGKLMKMNRNEEKWVKMNRNEEKWVKMNRNEEKWVKMNRNSKEQWINTIRNSVVNDLSRLAPWMKKLMVEVCRRYILVWMCFPKVCTSCTTAPDGGYRLRKGEQTNRWTENRK